MNSNQSIVVLIALTLYVSAVDIAEHCVSSNTCFQLNIPETTTRSGSGDVFFQLSGPTSYSWIGLGQGSGMAGANIFVMYTDGSGNVTVSPRLGRGHFEPEHDTAANITLLEGSGVRGGRMIANVRCSNCDSWNGGSMDFSGSSGDWIYASHVGDQLDSTDLNEEIAEHEAHGAFRWRFAAAQGGNSVNPFLSNQGQVSPPPQATGGADDTNGGDAETLEAAEGNETMLRAHAVLASIAFLALLPGGAILIRIPSLAHLIWVHAGIQIFAYCIFIAAAALGINMAHDQNMFSHAHPIIGVVLLAVLFTQPFMGLLHHHIFKRKQKRTIATQEHIWIGRVSIVLGMINGGFGLQMAGVTEVGHLAAYGVVAGVMGTAYVCAIIYSELTRRKRGQLMPRTDRTKEHQGKTEPQSI